MTNIIKVEEQKKQIDQIKVLTQIAIKSGKYKDYSESDIMNIMLTANDLGISPMKALNGGFYIVNGKISMSTALMVDKIRKEGHSIRITEWNKDKCVIIGIRKDNGDSVKFEFTLEDAQAAGLLGSPTWKKWPKQMLYNRCMATIARVLFPDVVGNSYNEDEKHDIAGIPPEKRPEEDPMPETIDVSVDVETGEIKMETLNNDHLVELSEMLEGRDDVVERINKWKGTKKLSELLEKDYVEVKKFLVKFFEQEKRTLSKQTTEESVSVFA